MSTKYYVIHIQNKRIRSNAWDSHKTAHEILLRLSINHKLKNEIRKASQRENILFAAIRDSTVLLGVATVMKWINIISLFV